MSKANQAPGRRDGRYQFLLANVGPRIFDHLQQDDHGQTFGDDIESAFATFAQFDPTHNAKGKKYGYLQWLCTQYLNSFEEGNTPIRADELETISEDIKFFMDLKKRRRHENFEKDLNRHTPQSLADLREEYAEKKSNNELMRDLKREVRAETTVHYDGPEGLILTPKTHRASAFWGQGTKWCTTMEQYFDSYTSGNRDLVIYIPAKPKSILPSALFWRSKVGRQRKYQGHVSNPMRTPADNELAWHPKNLKSLITAASQNQATAQYLVTKGSAPVALTPPESRTPLLWAQLVKEKYNKTVLFSKTRTNSLLSKLPAHIWQESTFLSSVASSYPQSLAFMPEEARTSSICQTAASSYSVSRDIASRSATKRFIEAHVPQRTMRDPRFVAFAAYYKPDLIGAIPAEQRTQEQFKSAFRSIKDHSWFGGLTEAMKLARAIPDRLWEDEDFAKSITSLYPKAVSYFPVNARTVGAYQEGLRRIHEESDMMGLTNCKRYIKANVPLVIQRNIEFAEFAVKTVPEAALKVPPEERTAKLCANAVIAKRKQSETLGASSATKLARRIAPEAMWLDEDFTMQVVDVIPSLIQYVPEESRSVALCKKAFYRQWFDTDVLTKTRLNAFLKKHIPQAVQRDIDFATYASSFTAKAALAIPKEERTPELCRSAFTRLKKDAIAKDVCAAAMAFLRDKVPAHAWEDRGFSNEVVGSLPKAIALIPEHTRNAEHYAEACAEQLRTTELFPVMRMRSHLRNGVPRDIVLSNEFARAASIRSPRLRMIHESVVQDIAPDLQQGANDNQNENGAENDNRRRRGDNRRNNGPLL